MKTSDISSIASPGVQPTGEPPPKSAGKENFQLLLDSANQRPSSAHVDAGGAEPAAKTPPVQHSPPVPSIPDSKAHEAYIRQASAASQQKMSDYEKYKDDQLLRNPGGKRYDLEKKQVSAENGEQKSFFARIGKDLSDVFGNVKNAFCNLLFGSKIRYRDENGDIQEAKQKGLMGSCVSFLKNVASALSFGAYHPDSPEGPKGFGQRLLYSASRLKDAILKDALGGTTQSLNHTGKNLILAGWNLVEVVPDATVGNFNAGRKATETIFDNGQVVVEYLTDVIPSGDAWLRVHAAGFKELKAPVVYNLKMPEHYKGDVRWQYIRNTPFRKRIETVGALLADALCIFGVGQTGISSGKERPPLD
ncbi:MAG: hypothetical protein ABFD98_02735 [Syntrophobacteraceae bacterium]